MGLLDNLIGMATGGAPAQDAQVHQGLIEHLLGSMGNAQGGGLGGLVDKLKAGGLSSAVNSWVGNGPNQSVSGDQIGAALGQDQIGQLAQKFGISNSEVSSHLSQILPELINHLTPNGQVPNPSMLQSAIGLLKGKLLSH